MTEERLVYYANPKKPWHEENVRWFRKIVNEYPQVRFFNPSPSLAPWHVQAVIQDVTLNFWPCAGKANVDREPAVYGYEEVKKILNRSLEDDFEVLEDE